MGAEFVRVGNVGQFQERRGRSVSLDGARVAVFRIDGRWYAIQDDCPHMGASLSMGRVGRNKVECHWHGWQFDLSPGSGDSRSGLCAKVYEVRIDGDDVLLRKPEPAPEPKDAAAPDEGQDEMISWDPDRFFRNKPID